MKILDNLLKCATGLNILRFETLGIITTDPYYQLRDDGFVEDIDKHGKKVSLELEMSEKDYNEMVDKTNNFSSESSLDLNYKTVGSFHYNENNLRGIGITYALDTGNKEHNISIKAHEETHVLHGIGKLHLLEEKIQKIIPNFDLKWAPEGKKDYHEEANEDKYIKEYIAGLGSCYALNSRGIPLSLIKNYEWNKAVIRAFEDYQKLLNGENVRLGI